MKQTIKKPKTTETYISIEPCCREFLLWVLLYQSSLHLEFSSSCNYNIPVRLTTKFLLQKAHNFLLSKQIFFSISNIKLCLYNFWLIPYSPQQMGLHIWFGTDFLQQMQSSHLSRIGTNRSCMLACYPTTQNWAYVSYQLQTRDNWVVR